MSKFRIYQSPIIVSTLMVAIVLVFLFLLNYTLSIFSQINFAFENTLKDYAQNTPLGNTVSKTVTLVQIDDKTLRDTNKGWLWKWQNFKRSYYAKVLQNLHNDGAIVIGLDVLLADAGDATDDATLAQTIRSLSSSLVLAFSASQNGEASVFPTDVFMSSGTTVWFVNQIPSDANGIVYSVLPAQKVGDEYYENFALATLRKYFEITFGQDFPVDENAIGTDLYTLYKNDSIAKQIVYEREEDPSDKSILLEYGTDLENIPKISFVDAYNRTYNRNLVKNRIILIGSTATALRDTFSAPGNIIPGIVLHAATIKTALNGKTQYFSYRRETLLLALYIFALSLVYVGLSRRIFSIVSFFLLPPLFYVAYIMAYVHFGKIFNFPLLFFIAPFFTFTAASVYRYFHEGHDKRLLKNALWQYLAEDLVLNVLNNYDELKLWGERREVVSFFSDIAGFTSVSEKLEAEELVRLLAEYLQEVSDVIIQNHGFINKYEWDAVMALWWVFAKNDDKVSLACKAALEQQKRIEALSPVFVRKFGFELKVRMGINVGSAIVGNIGSLGKKIEFTAIGDSINVASRLEGINKVYGSFICVSEAVTKQAGDTFIFRKLDNVKVKGKKETTAIYELLGENTAENKMLQQLKTDFEKALQQYSNGDFTEAKEAFETILAWKNNDKPTETFIKRCEKQLKDGTIKEDWNGIFTAKEK